MNMNVNKNETKKLNNKGIEPEVVASQKWSQIFNQMLSK